LFKAEAAPRDAAGAGGDIFPVFNRPIDFEDGDATGDGVEEFVNGGLEIVLPFPCGGLLIVEDVLDEGGLFEGGGRGFSALLGPRLKVEGKLADRLLDLVQVGAEAIPSVLHRVEQLVLEHKIATASFVENPAKGLGIEVDRDRRQLVVAGVRADDSFGNTHPKESRAEVRPRGVPNLTGFHCGRKGSI
jgi:hypothetical protein